MIDQQQREILERNSDKAYIVCLYSTVVLTAYFYAIVCLQIIYRRIDFFLDMQSYLEILSLLLNTFILINAKTSIVESDVTVFCIFWAVILMWA